MRRVLSLGPRTMIDSLQMPARYLLFILLGVASLSILGLGYSLYRTSVLTRTYDQALAAKEDSISTLVEEVAELRTGKWEAEQAFQHELSRNTQFEKRINTIAGTVGTLTKIAETDPELLAKYSKVYFLNENYIPADLSRIDPEFLYDEDEELYFHTKALPRLERLLAAAAEDGIDMRIASAYRSFETQKGLKATYAVTYGTGANRFSADQGYSEHQLGTTIDFTTASLRGGFTGFQNTEAYTWLTENAHLYGFVLSYPEQNAYYIYEPWHWRYVGLDLARKLHDENKHFYDLDQREIDEYLVSLFD